MTSDRDVRPDPEMDGVVQSWLSDTDLTPDEADHGLDRLLKDFPVTPQHKAKWLGRWFGRGEGATRSTGDHGSPSDTNSSTRRTRFMFSATGLVAGIAVLALAVNVIAPTSDPAISGAEDGVLIVAADGSGEYATITEAVTAASDGDTLLVRPGTYVEAVVIDKDITLKGDGPVEDIVIIAPEDGPMFEGSPRDYYALLLEDVDNGIVSGLTFRGEPSILVVSGGSPEIRDSVFDQTGWAFGTRGLSFDGSSVQVNAGSTATISGNSLVDGGPVGVFGESAPVISGNTFSGGPHIFLSRFGDGTVIADNDIDGTLRWAIGVFDSGEFSVEGNRISNAGVIGMNIAGGTALIARNGVAGTDTGIMVSSGTAEIIDNELTGNGVGIRGPGLEIVRGNIVRDGFSGIVLSSKSPLVQDNVVEGHASAGITIGRAASPILSGNVVCGNAQNLRLVDGASPVIDDTNQICEDAPTE